MLELTRDGAVFVLRMAGGENRFGPGMIEAFGAALDEVEAAGSPCALVTTGTERFYSNGLDLDYMRGEGQARAGDYLADVLGILARVLCFPAATVAAMNGHAFGAGAQLAVAHDFRVMRSGRGYFCMPEIDMRVPLHPGMTAILQARLPVQTCHEVIATGRRFPAEAALAAGIVEEVAPEEEVVARAVARAAPLAEKAHPVLRTLKEGMYGPVLAALRARLAPGALRV